MRLGRSVIAAVVAAAACACGDAPVDLGNGDAGGGGGAPVGAPCSTHADCAERTACSAAGVCESLPYDNAGPYVESHVPTRLTNLHVGTPLEFTFNEPIRVKGEAATLTREFTIDRVASEAVLTGERTLRLLPTGLVPPARLDLAFPGVSDLSGNRWADYPLTLDYPQWVRRDLERYDPNLTATMLTAAVDANGAPVIGWSEVFGSCSGQLHARRHDGSTWQDLGGTLNADPAHGARNPSLAAGGGKVGLAWNEGAGCVASEIHVALLEEGAFSRLTPVVTGATLAENPSLALDANGRPFVAWLVDANTIEAARWTGAEWQALGTVSDPAKQAFVPAVAFSPEGEPCVAFAQLQSATPLETTIQLRCHDGTGWVARGGPITEVNAAFVSFSARALAFDAEARPVIAWSGNEVIYAAQLGATGWTVSQVSSTESRGGAPELAIDPVLGPVAGFCDDREVRSSVRGPNGWAEVEAAVDVYDLTFVSGCALATGSTGPWLPWIDDDLDLGTLIRAVRFNR